MGISLENKFGAARLTLNGEIIKLHGYNRHTMWNDTGSALTYEQVKEDISLLIGSNANMVRGSHYPQDQVETNAFLSGECAQR